MLLSWDFLPGEGPRIKITQVLCEFERTNPLILTVVAALDEKFRISCCLFLFSYCQQGMKEAVPDMYTVGADCSCYI